MEHEPASNLGLHDCATCGFEHPFSPSELKSFSFLLSASCPDLVLCQTSPKKSTTATSEPVEEMPSIQIKSEPEEVECMVVSELL
ncbi:hypothetical protein DPX16_22695 [Anabarilius grahami]|uniref:Uncharacterized protein n=1 Tax=Anabarilius grahami TaxID=495550 RepID=A0A3N0XZ66_ANAGA|nr:hypothetical protein DPX16_22695 [Anabarilius grahami]